jgi:hypothetical protein
LHTKDGKPEKLQLQKLSCNVKFYKWEPLDLNICPYVVLVVKGVHSHPPPSPHSIPKTVKDQLQKIIESSNQNLEDVTPRKLISGKLVF